MFEALKQRLHEIELAHEALPVAAIAIANKVRRDVDRSRSHRRKRETAQRKESEALIGAKIKTRRRKTSGVAIRVLASKDEVKITASSQVHHFAREKTEVEGWKEIFVNHVVAAAKGGK
jgi:hypothetical protein